MTGLDGMKPEDPVISLSKNGCTFHQDFNVHVRSQSLPARLRVQQNYCDYYKEIKGIDSSSNNIL